MADKFNDNGIEEFDSWVTPATGFAADDDIDALLARALGGGEEFEEPGEQETLFAEDETVAESAAAEAEAEDAPEEEGEDDAEDVEDDAPHAVSEEQRARAMMAEMPSALGDVVEDSTAGTKVTRAYLGKEMAASFLEYSMSVIVSRALPDVRDGLKPVHRRILYAMNEAGFKSNKPYMKSARTVGDVIGKYHPHGDASVYDAMVRLAQPFNMRVPLVDGHGNFGSIDGDPPAAMRYTESRLGKAGETMLEDLDKETVDFQPNYDESLSEPTVLPARFPNLLVNGSNGIAVGMATNIPPHNLGEAIDATCAMIDNPKITTDELLKIMPGPDFPTGALILGRQGIRDYYETGRGSLTIRAKAEIKELKGGKSQIIIKEIPYQVNRQRMLERLGELVREKKLPEISNIHDGADRHGIDIIIDLKANAMPQVVLNKLYKHTQMQVGFGVIMLALVDGVPRVLSLKEVLHYYIKHQESVVTRRTKYDLARAEARAHILEGYIIALDNIDEVIQIIRSSRDDTEAARRLQERFGLDKKQTDAILEMKLRRLTGLSREETENELAALREAIAYYRSILKDKNLLHKVIKDELLAVKKRFATPRRTRIQDEAKEIDVEDLIAEENMVVTITKAGYVKRLPVNTYRQQKRGGKGMQGVNLKESDFVEHLFVASTHDYMLFFTTKGRVYRLKVYEIPEATRYARGTAIVNLLQLEKGEGVAAVISTKDFPKNEYLMFATEQGMVKKTSMELYDRTRAGGLIAINLHDDDRLISVKRVAPGDKIMMVSSAGKAICWEADEVRSMGRDTAGVRGMTVDGTDVRVLGMEIAREGADLLVITEKGYGKRTPVSEYPVHHRGGQGVFTIVMTPKKGDLSVMKVVNEDDELMIITEAGVVVRTQVKGISQQGRQTQGVTIMNVADKDRVVGAAAGSDDKKKAKKGASDEGADDLDLSDTFDDEA